MLRLLPATLLALISTALAADEPRPCRTDSLPNPIASRYYANITGTINGTMAILPIPYALARRIIPSEYEILTEQYHAMVPELPRGMYPALLQAVFDHDIRYMDYNMPDFSRASIEFPFVRYYADENTPFRYNPSMFMTSTNEMGIKGSSEYGADVYPAEFEPSCNAYVHAKNGKTSYYTRAGEAFLESTWKHIVHKTPAASLMRFVKHTTNQPLFGLGGMCNHQLRMFNTILSAGEHAPRVVKGAVRANIPRLSDTELSWSEAIGVQVSSAFIEKHLVPCEEMRHWRFDDSEMQDDPAEDGNLEL